MVPMNRHQRRASKKSAGDSTITGIGDQHNLYTDLADSSQQLQFDKLTPDVHQGVFLTTPLDLDSPENAPAQKNGFFVRLLAKVLFAPWVLRRISNPVVEELLIPVAKQLGRHDVADELIRREALRRN
jgi:hypothetical protein